jgi:hypothetical protein
MKYGPSPVTARFKASVCEEKQQLELHNQIKGRLTKFHFGQHKTKMNLFWAHAKNRKDQMAYTGVRVDSTMEEEEGNTISIDEGKLSRTREKGLEE